MSASQIVGAVAGVIVGVVTENPQLGFMTYAAVSGVGAYLEQPDRQGPRLDDLRSQISSYGNPIPFCYGCNRFAGTVIWPRIIEAKERPHSESAKGGPQQVNYTYTDSFAVLVCEGPIAGIRRIWANKKLVYDVSVENEGAIQDPAISGLRFYLGTNDQEPDPLIEAREGSTPAYLGYAYVVFEDYDVTEMNGRVPQFEFEVVQVGTPEVLSPVEVGIGFMCAIFTNPNTGDKTLHTTYDDQYYVYDPETLELLQQFTLPSAAYSITAGPSNGLWVGHENAPGLSLNCATSIDLQLDGTFAVGTSTNFGSGSAIIRLGTAVWNEALGIVYGFKNNGISAGGYTYPPLAASGITVPNWVYFSVEMPTINRIALAGYGRWLVIAEESTDSTLATIENTTWGANVQEHRIQYDASRGCLYWATCEDANVYKVDLTSFALTLLITVGLNGMHYDSHTDKIYVDSGADLLVYSPEGALLETRVGHGVLTGNARGNSSEFNDRYYFASEAGHLWRIPIGGRLSPDQVWLSDIVTDLWTRPGLTSGQIDVTDLEGIPVDGFLVGRQMTTRSATEPLQTAFTFDVVESDRKIKAVLRGGDTITTIPMEDRAAHVPGQDMPDHLEVLRAFEYELPYQCDVEYTDIDADHQVGNQYDRRITKDTRQRINLQLPIAMGAEHAKKVARVVLYDAWKKLTFKFSTTVKYAYLEPTDLIYLPTENVVHLAMITNRRDQPNGIIEWEARVEDLDSYDQSGADAVPIPYTPQTVFEPADTILELMDSPLMRDQDQSDGFYVAMGGNSTSWRGGQLFRSEDGGSTYTSVLSAVDSSVIGRATTALGDFTGGDVFDEGGSVTVVIETGGTLTNYTTDQVLAGYGAFLLGDNGRWEAGNYTTATLIAANTYSLTGLLRGRRGTEWAIGTHQVGDRFIFGSVDTWRIYNPPSGDLNVERQYKAPAFRSSLADAAAESFTDRAIRRRPYSVAHLKAEPLNDGGLTVSWMHRSLVGSAWDTGLAVPLDATFVSFSVTISSIDGTVIRRFSTTDEAFPYAASDIEDGFGSIPPVMLIRVAQRNSDYGDGVGVTLRTDDGTITYDFDDPLSGPYVPPDTTVPPTPPDAGAPIPAGNQWYGPNYWAPILWDGTKFVASNVYGKAVISTGALWTSTDGLTFTQLSANNMAIPFKVAAYHGGTYVNQSNGSKPWYSTDLEAWTEGAFNAYPSGYPYDSGSPFSQILHDGTRFVAVRRNGEITSSATGATWDHKCNVTIPTDPSSNLAGNGLEAWGFAYGAGVYVAVGIDPSGGSSLSDRIWTASNYDGPYAAQDGAPVVDHGGGPIDKAYLYSVSFCSDDGYFYAVGAKRYYFEPSNYYVPTGVIIRSTDGVTWSDVTPTPVVAPTYKGCLAYSFHKVSGGYVVLGTNAYWTSSDGATWTEHALLPFSENQLYSQQFGASNGTIVATQEYQWLSRDAYADMYRKPITFDGSTFDPTLDSPYP